MRATVCEYAWDLYIWHDQPNFVCLSYGFRPGGRKELNWGPSPPNFILQDDPHLNTTILPVSSTFLLFESNNRHEEGLALQALQDSEKLLQQIDIASAHIQRVYRVQLIPTSPP